MTDKTNILEDSSARLVTADSRHPLRYVFALPFAAYGGYLLWHLVSGLYAYFRESGLVDTLAMLPGVAVGLFFTALFLAPAIVLLARRNTVVDTDLGVVGRRWELLGLHTRGKITNTADVEKVVCRRQTRKNPSRIGNSDARRETPVTHYLVDLERPALGTLNLFDEMDRKTAKMLGEKVATLLDRPLNDRL